MIGSKTIGALVHGTIAVLLSMAFPWQGAIAADQAPVPDDPVELTMIRVFPYPDGVPAFAADAPASCYRIGRCSAYDLHLFRDRPNRLARLAPQSPPDPNARLRWLRYEWVLAPVTPEENIHPEYRAASRVRDEYRGVGTPLDERD